MKGRSIRGSWAASSVAGLICIALLSASACSEAHNRGSDPFQTWEVYGGDASSSRYSSLNQINKGNVGKLQVAWVHHTGDAPEGGSQIQCNPIVVDGLLYATSPGLKAIALDAGSGERVWTFDPWPEHTQKPWLQGHNRGVAYWQDASGADRRIFFSAASRLYALDAATGRPIASFGNQGWIDLREGLDRDIGDRWVIATTPGIVFEDLLIQGSRVSEGTDAAPGHIRAYDVRSGEMRWIFHTIPHPGELGYESWPPDAWKTVGGANSWPGMALDEERGLVFIPTGSAAFDYYGGNRSGENLFANCLLALNARTGERVWHFQSVHHDIYDRDLPAPPNLLSVEQDGRRIDAVAQVTKAGMVFLFERETGRPLFPIEERPVPPSPLKGESAWPTQPFPVKPPPFTRQEFSRDQISDISPQAHAYIEERYDKARAEGPFAPVGLDDTIFFPGLDGGAEWGGAAVGGDSGILYVNASIMPWILVVHEEEQLAGREASAPQLYEFYCQACHRPDRGGDGGRNPSLRGIQERRSRQEIVEVIRQGRGFMPAYRNLSEGEVQSLASYLLDGASEDLPPPPAAQADPNAKPQLAYSLSKFERFFDQHGYPAIKPPWGTLNAIDLNRGEILWQVPLGVFPELTARGLPPTGTENYGGPIVTAGGLIFIGASKDEKFRAFDSFSGQLLWETDLPAGGYATPATYEHQGKQYVVIAAGGGKMGTKPGDAYVAFALPEDGGKQF